MIQDVVRDRLDSMRGIDSEDILAALGLQRRRSALDALLPAAGIFAAGLVVGTGVALLLAPKSGREIRRELKGRATQLTHSIGESAGEIADQVRDVVGHRAEEVGLTATNGTPTDRKPVDSTQRTANAPK